LRIKNRKLNFSKKNNFDWDTTTKYANYFAVKDNIVRKIYGFSSQITSKDPLSARSTINFRLLKYGGKWSIFFGIITESRKQSRWSGNSYESVGY